MRSSLVLGVVFGALFSLSVHAAPSAGPTSLSAARQRLEGARATLGQAVQRIEKDPPATEDLDAAHAAVESLKDAIDKGVDHEAEDLDYARSALAARKELRTLREYVDQRRAKIQLFNLRRQLEQLLAGLNDHVRKLEGREPTPKEFDDARASARALKTSLEHARPLVKEDPGFASYVSEAESTLARQERAMDDRWALLTAEKQRALVEESRQALTAVMAKLGKGASDADFSAADRSSALLAKRLEEGRPLEAREASYSAVAGKARRELAQANAQIAELIREVGLARMQAEVEPARRDLIASGQALRGKSPTPEQFAEARTAAIVVRKLLEKYQPQVARSSSLGQYAVEVKKTLSEVEDELQLRALGAAQAELTEALKKLERRSGNDEDAEKANSAVSNLEKTLASLPSHTPALVKPAADARALLHDARAAIARRHLELDIQRQRAKVDAAKKNAAAKISDLQKPDAHEEQLVAAQESVKQLRAAVDDGNTLARKDGDYAAFALETRKRAAELDERIASRRTAISVRDARALLTEALTSSKAKVEAAQRIAGTDADIEAAAKSIEELSKALELHAKLEKQDKGYAAHADRARLQLGRSGESLELAKASRELRRVTGEALASGAAAAASGDAARDLHAQRDQYEKALSQFKSCEDEGQARLKSNAALAKSSVLVDDKPTSPKEVIALCAQRAQSIEPRLHEVRGIIRFEEGAKRAYETGKTLLGQGKKSAASAQFGECVAESLIVQHQYPELKARPFDIAGTQLTPASLVQECIQQKKATEPR